MITTIEIDRDFESRERLAAYAHDAWAGWMKDMFFKCDFDVVDGGDNVEMRMPKGLYERWRRKMTTSYGRLSAYEKGCYRDAASIMKAMIKTEEKQE